MRTFLCVFAIVLACDAYNILVATPNAVKSESLMAASVAYQLAKAGHHVTFISCYKGLNEHQNLTIIWLPEVQAIHENPGEDFLDQSVTALYKFIEIFYKKQNERIWANPEVMKLWKRRNEFDLLITMSYYSEGIFPFLMDNNIPMIQIISMGAEHLALSKQGNWLTPAVLPSMLTEFYEDMTFWERTINLFSTIQFHYLQEKVVPRYTEPVTAVFPNIGHYSSYYDRVALTMINGHFAMDSPLPLLPNQIEIGGMNIKTPKPLDKELSSFVEGAGKAGIIYFSLGSIAKSSELSSSIKEKLMEAFRRIPQRVLWKYEDSELIVPPNVLIRKWMPQQDILAHPMTRVFISHCGTFSSQEAKYFGVPILGMPVMFDQPRNAAKLVKKKYAISLSWNDLEVEDVVDSLNTLINDTSYTERMKAVSRLLKDQKETPTERAIWWVEYIVRHKGAPHLQYAGKRLSLFQYIMLDVIIFWLIIFNVLLFSVIYVVKVFCFGKGKDKTADKQQKKKKNQ